MSDKNNHIDYVELPAADIAAAKQFYSSAFGWKYQDWGDRYADTHDGGITTGISAVEERPRAPLVVLYADDLEATRERVRAAGGTITADIFEFPGGRRFHFHDPAGNELAAWSATAEH
jgi:predicted enzyme related to lactoylglutathione lyase